MKLNIRREHKIGFFFALGLILFLWGVNFLKGKDFFVTGNILYAEYEDVAGLTKSNSVIINGLKLGKVDDIFFKPDGSGKLIVKIIVSQHVKIPRNSIAKIVSADILGSKSIQIVMGKNKNELIKSGDTLKSEVQITLQEELSGQLVPFKQKAEKLMGSIDSFMVILQQVFNDQTKNNLIASFESLKNTMRTIERISYNTDTLLRSQRYRLAEIVGNVESITKNIKNNNQKITNVINNFSNISDSLAKSNISNTIYNANNAILSFSKIMEKINKGEGSMGMLVNNDSLYNSLDSTTKQLNYLLEDMRLHPKRYVHFSIFGNKDKSDKKKNKKK